MGKKSKTKQANKEVKKASILIECDYTIKDGITEVHKTELHGNNAILMLLGFGLIKQLCADANVNYREMLSNTIKQEVMLEFKEKMKKQWEEEENNGKQDNN